MTKRKPVEKQDRTVTATTRSKTVDDLLLGDVIVEYEHRKPKFFKVTSIITAACSPHKTHVTVDGVMHWCYDSAMPILARQDG